MLQGTTDNLFYYYYDYYYHIIIIFTINSSLPWYFYLLINLEMESLINSQCWTHLYHLVLNSPQFSVFAMISRSLFWMIWMIFEWFLFSEQKFRVHWRNYKWRWCRGGRTHRKDTEENVFAMWFNCTGWRLL